jgi:enterochelin esterase-like enzyme
MNRSYLLTSARVGPHKLHVDIYSPARPQGLPPLLAIGGAFDGSWIYSRFAPIIAGMGWPVFCMNLRGFYKSRWNHVGDLSANDYLADIAAVRRGLKLKDPVLVGYSVGGLLAMKSAEEHGARALILYDSDPPRDIAEEAHLPECRDFMDHRGIVPSVLNFLPTPAIVEEMWGRKVTKQEYLGQLELFRQSFLSGRAFRELEVDRLPVGRLRCPVLHLGISARNRCHQIPFRRGGVSWYVFEGYSHGSLLVNPKADRITRMVASWMRSEFPLGDRKVFRTVEVEEEADGHRHEFGGSVSSADSRRIAKRSGSHLVVSDESVLVNLRYYSGWANPVIRVHDHGRAVDLPMRRIADGRVPGEGLFAGIVESSPKKGFCLAEGDAEDRPHPHGLYHPELKEAWLADGEFTFYPPPAHGTPPRTIDLKVPCRSLEHEFFVRVILPRNYVARRAYPIAVLNDGHNVWTNQGSHGGWHADTIADGLFRKGVIREIVLVGVYGHRYRNRALLPAPLGRAHQYVDWLADELLPRLRKQFHLTTHPWETAVIGASYGATNAVYAGLKRPDVFGMVGTFSYPYLQGSAQLKQIEAMAHRPFRRLYADCGTKWSHDQPRRDDFTSVTRKLVRICSEKWMTHGKDLLGLVAEGHYHNENYWRMRVGGCLRFLFR